MRCCSTCLAAAAANAAAAVAAPSSPEDFPAKSGQARPLHRCVLLHGKTRVKPTNVCGFGPAATAAARTAIRVSVPCSNQLPPQQQLGRPGNRHGLVRALVGEHE